MPEEVHHKAIEDGEGMIDWVRCTCGWSSPNYFDGREFAMADWRRHRATAKARDHHSRRPDRFYPATEGQDPEFVRAFEHEADKRDSAELAKKIKFQPGDHVVKEGGDYTFDGWVAGLVFKRSGAIRYVVEDDRGLLFIFNAAQLRAKVEKRGECDEQAEAAIPEA